MALPKVKTPRFTVSVEGVEYDFRPFLVGEEKVLLMAAESKNPTQILNAVCDVVTSCTFNKVDAKELETHILEYLFINIRARSVSEISEFFVFCQNEVDGVVCKGRIPVQVNLLDVKIGNKIERDNVIRLTDEIAVKVKLPTIADIAQFKDLKDPVELINKTIYAGIVALTDGDEVYTKDDFKYEEFVEWLNLLNRPQFLSLKHFFESAPTLEHAVETKCPKCGNVHSLKLKGLMDFFQ